jgi:hypothetical protein
MLWCYPPGAVPVAIGDHDQLNAILGDLAQGLYAALEVRVPQVNGHNGG